MIISGLEEWRENIANSRCIYCSSSTPNSSRSGRGEEIKVQKTIDSYHKVAREIGELSPDTIIITTPHTILYSDYFHISPGNNAKGDFSRFGAKDVSFSVEYDDIFVEELEALAERRLMQAGTLGEKDPGLDHGTMVPLYFINQYLSNYKLVRVGLSGLPVTDHYKLGRCIKETSDKLARRVVFVASGDLSHRLKEDGPYGYTKEGEEFDREVTQAMKKGDFLRFLTFSPDFSEKAAECGLKSFIIMAGALSGLKCEPEFLSYEGSFGVGYAICSYKIRGEDESRHFDLIFEEEQKRLARERQKSEDAYVSLARLSLETFIRTGTYTKLPQELPKEMLSRKAGVFVSLKNMDSLEGVLELFHLLQKVLQRRYLEMQLALP